MSIPHPLIPRSERIAKKKVQEKRIAKLNLFQLSLDLLRVRATFRPWTREAAIVARASKVMQDFDRISRQNQTGRSMRRRFRRPTAAPLGSSLS